MVAYVTAKQAQMLLFYFEVESLLPHLRILEMHFPNHDQFTWIDPFPRDNLGFVAMKNYSDVSIWDTVAIGYAIHTGYFDNEVARFFKHLPEDSCR